MAKPVVLGSCLLLVAISLLASCPGLSAQPFVISEPMAPTILGAVPESENNNVLRALISYLDPEDPFLAFINADRGTDTSKINGGRYIVLAPGNGTMAKAILNHLPNLSKENATILAKGIILYHALSWFSPRPWESPELKLSSFSRTAVDQASSLPKALDNTTYESVSIKVLDAKSNLLLASGVASGAVINLKRKSLGGYSCVYLMDDLLLPPNSALAALYPYSIYGIYGTDVDVATYPVEESVAAGVAKLSTQSAGFQSSGGQGVQFLNLAKEVDPELYAALNSTSSAYTVFLPSDVALFTYMSKRGLTAAKFPKAVLRRHVIIARAYLIDSFVTMANITLPYATFAAPSAKFPGPSTFLGGGLERNPFAGGFPEQTMYEMCAKTNSKGVITKITKGRKIQMRRWATRVGKSIIYNMDQVFDFCETAPKRRAGARRSLQ